MCGEEIKGENLNMYIKDNKCESKAKEGDKIYIFFGSSVDTAFQHIFFHSFSLSFSATLTLKRHTCEYLRLHYDTCLSI